MHRAPRIAPLSAGVAISFVVTVAACSASSSSSPPTSSSMNDAIDPDASAPGDPSCSSESFAETRVEPPVGACVTGAACEFTVPSVCLPGALVRPDGPREWQCTCASGTWSCNVLDGTFGTLPCPTDDAGDAAAGSAEDAASDGAGSQ